MSGQSCVPNYDAGGQASIPDYDAGNSIPDCVMTIRYPERYPDQRCEGGGDRCDALCWCQKQPCHQEYYTATESVEYYYEIRRRSVSLEDGTYVGCERAMVAAGSSPPPTTTQPCPVQACCPSATPHHHGYVIQECQQRMYLPDPCCGGGGHHYHAHPHPHPHAHPHHHHHSWAGYNPQSLQDHQVYLPRSPLPQVAGPAARVQCQQGPATPRALTSGLGGSGVPSTLHYVTPVERSAVSVRPYLPQASVPQAYFTYDHQSQGLSQEEQEGVYETLEEVPQRYCCVKSSSSHNQSNYSNAPTSAAAAPRQSNSQVQGQIVGHTQGPMQGHVSEGQNQYETTCSRCEYCLQSEQLANQGKTTSYSGAVADPSTPSIVVNDDQQSGAASTSNASRNTQGMTPLGLQSLRKRAPLLPMKEVNMDTPPESEDTGEGEEEDEEDDGAEEQVVCERMPLLRTPYLRRSNSAESYGLSTAALPTSPEPSATPEATQMPRRDSPMSRSMPSSSSTSSSATSGGGDGSGYNLTYPAQLILKRSLKTTSSPLLRRIVNARYQRSQTAPASRDVSGYVSDGQTGSSVRSLIDIKNDAPPKYDFEMGQRYLAQVRAMQRLTLRSNSTSGSLAQTGSDVMRSASSGCKGVRTNVVHMSEPRVSYEHIPSSACTHRPSCRHDVRTSNGNDVRANVSANDEARGRSNPDLSWADSGCLPGPSGFQTSQNSRSPRTSSSSENGTTSTRTHIEKNVGASESSPKAAPCQILPQLLFPTGAVPMGGQSSTRVNLDSDNLIRFGTTEDGKNSVVIRGNEEGIVVETDTGSYSDDDMSDSEWEDNQQSLNTSPSSESDCPDYHDNASNNSPADKTGKCSHWSSIIWSPAQVDLALC